MARPTKWRKIGVEPSSPYFLPAKEAAEDSEVIPLLLEELEAIRLKDLLGMEQEECAKEMEVSRPTFQRILLSAREKIADSIVNGKTLHISGGNYTKHICNLACSTCGKVWTESVENFTKRSCHSYECPSCGSRHVGCAKRCEEHFCQKRCCKKHSE
ncbi:protein of unknown function DUF134 [Lachnospiraceae bacterium KM106-2]|nr:protein of unknown function DUF134 [Lachnospiraceae bacterium KM106-2]